MFYSPGTRALHTTRALYATIVVLCSALTSGAFADSLTTIDQVKADELFKSGKQLLADEDFAHACPLLAESNRLDPATGTMLALAFCHEREGKLGSALREYNEVAARAHNEGRGDRERAARERASALQPRLSKLTIATSNVRGLDELEVRVNGARIERERLDQALPIDGGTHMIEALAKGKKPWRAEVRMAKSIDDKTVIIPALEDVPAPVVEPVAVVSTAAKPVAARRSLPPPVVASRARRAPLEERPVDRSPGLAPVQVVGLTAIGVGLVGVGVGTIFAANALSRSSESSMGCIGDLCSAEARQERLDARSAGNAATIAFITGGGLAAVGITMYLLGKPSTSSAGSARAAISVAPYAGSHEFGGVVRGSL